MNIEEFIIDENSTILEAMERLDKVAQKVLFIVKEGKLEAALTDGDIRRWILKKGALDAPVKNAANYSPKHMTGGSKKEALQMMKEHYIEALPILDKEGRIMRKKMFQALEKVYGVLMTISFFGGVLPLIPFLMAMVIGGEVGESIAIFLHKQYYPWVITTGSVAIVIGLIAMYLGKLEGLSVKNVSADKKNKEEK